MMLSIYTPYFDLDGVVQTEYDIVDSTLGNESRRGNRTATIDGGAIYTDLGFSESDKTFSFSLKKIDKKQIANLKRFLREYREVFLTISGGVYNGVIVNLNTSVIPIKFDFLVIKKVA